MKRVDSGADALTLPRSAKASELPKINRMQRMAVSEKSIGSAGFTGTAAAFWPPF
jgi:hypothetical protein